MLKSLLAKVFTGKPKTDSATQKLIQQEALLGGRLFAKESVSAFFCLNERTWLRREERCKQRQRVLRYDIRFDKVYKKEENAPDWQHLGLEEARQLHKALSSYRSQVVSKLYPDYNWPAQ